ncbi:MULTISPECIES: helix-turn-helix transcriptional regulator [Chryseobacterium]|uniref:Helix-turn-helix n=1 Tax=Chryseobacterium taeanense TaxID=311334 RepID=A0A1G8HXL9_9FLAO|nr:MULTISPECIES: helix-turn-helix transcriptional regulator [Chryseobacterium]WFB66865.1 helix-turn-helix transcriptional regulator [Chryseobacterium sp. WX]SDI11409.1 Helix-turn-helix [Chryseobacterium taeanense]
MDKSEILKKIGKRIKEVRLQKGISQADLVGKMDGNIDPTNISRIEAGRTNPTVITLFRIAEAMDMKLADLVNLESTEI